jgi:hypothetical protein
LLWRPRLNVLLDIGRRPSSETPLYLDGHIPIIEVTLTCWVE